MNIFKFAIVSFLAGACLLVPASFADDSFLDDLLADLEDPINAEEALSDDEMILEGMDDELDDLLGDFDDVDLDEPVVDDDDVSMEPPVEDPLDDAGDVSEDISLDDLLGDLDDEEIDEPVDFVDDDDVSMEPPVAVVEDVDDEVADDDELGLTPEQVQQQRIVALQAKEADARLQLDEAYRLLSQNRFETGARAMNEAISTMPVRPANDEILRKARQDRARAYADWSRASLRRQDFEDARTRLSEAQRMSEQLDPDFRTRITRDIDNISSDIQRAERRYAEETSPRAVELQRIAEDQETIEDLIESGKEMLKLGNYDRAETQFKRVLNLDPYHTGAMRLIRKIEEDRYRLSTIERRSTVSGMIQEVRDSWNPPISLELRAPTEVQRIDQRIARTDTQELRRKMEEIIIPSIEFRQANIVDVIDFLRDASEAADPDGVGVNIISKISDQAPAPRPAEREPAARRPAQDDFWDEWDFDEPTAQPDRPVATSTIPTITLNLRRVSLMDAIQYVTEVAGLKFRLERNVVIITPADAVEGQIITRMYPVQPSFLDIVVTRQEDTQRRRAAGGGGEFIAMGTMDVSMERADVKQFFENAGVRFPTGTSITYNPGISQLIVSNTPENLEVFESILAQLNVVPRQVEIETRFVEVSQTDLEEVGFEWLLNDNYEMLVRDGPGPVGSRQRLVMNRNEQGGGFTRGMRFWQQGESGIAATGPSIGALGGLGGILGISSVLTNPEVSMVLHALDQRGGSDLLSAPRVTTRSGVNAEIKVVREIIYPTEFRSDVQTLPTIDDQGRRIDQRTVVVTPEGFETRETGVILNVTPTVGPDGYTIDLSMVPEVVELADWIQYGSDLYNMPQPIFTKRTIATSIIIWDGQTVVMGGMIREQLTSFDDKIPLLGDIPLLGRLFRSKGEYSQKQNLLIFVTARLVDPAGNRIRRPDDPGAVSVGSVPQQPAS